MSDPSVVQQQQQKVFSEKVASITETLSLTTKELSIITGMSATSTKEVEADITKCRGSIGTLLNELDELRELATNVKEQVFDLRGYL